MEDLNGEQSLASFTDMDKISSLLKRESRFFVGIERSEFQRLTDALEQLDNFLEDADEDSTEQVMRESVDSWLEETVFEPDVKGYMEENCVLKLSRLLQERRIVNFLSGAGHRFGRLNSIRNRFAETASEKSETLSNSNDPMLLNSSRNVFSACESEKSETLLVDNEEATSRVGIAERHNRRQFYSFLEEYVESTAKDLTVLLIDEPPKRFVISLVGPSGIGKTILARKVYDNEIVRDRFDCCGWIEISSSYDIKEILKAMIKQTTGAGQVLDVEELNGMRTIELLSTLRQSLQPKRYMFVFDNVCHEDFWHFMKQGLPDNEKGCRIIVTTARDKLFADSCEVCSIDHVHSLGPLSDSMSQDLFIRTTFQDETEQLCPLELERFTVRILRMCKGFPFPIVAIAGLLSTKEKIVSKWEKIHCNFRLEFKFNHNPPSALDVLTLSFLDLPNYLRPCFLYFSIFPEQSLIPTDKIFKLWIAEGFVEEKKGRTLEEVAEEYLNELVKRNMVQACQDFQGLEKFCQVHRLIHNMARLKANELDFYNVHDEQISSSKQNSLRLSICNVSNGLHIVIPNSRVRSVFLYNIGALHRSFLVALIKNCDLLTLLDLENVPVENLPEELGNLVHLKYLSLKNTKVKKLPESVGKLQNLQTFDLRNTLLIELPLAIKMLKSLQHLLASVRDNTISGDSTRGARMRVGIGWLDKLHTLMTLDVRLGGINLIKEIAKLRRLRRLSISGLTAEVGIALCTALNALIHLETLILQAKSNEVLKLQTISAMLTHLRCLVLKGQLQKFPYLMIRLPNLTTLCLSLSKLTNDPINDLNKLPNLESLWLYQAYEGEKLYFENRGFQRLKLLVLTHLRGLNAVEIQKGSLPCLEELRIGSILHLNEVPFGIEHLRNLKVLAIYDMPSEFVLSMQPNCSDYWKVEHIPCVTFWYRVDGRSYKMYKLGDLELLDHISGEAASIDLVVLNPYELELSFCDSDDEEDEDDDVDQLSNLSSSRSFFLQKNAGQWSFSSGFYTDDVEE